jgi:hypothetical protein
MKKLIYCSLISVFSIICLTAKAQDFALGVKGGISIPNLSAGGSSVTPLNTGYSSRLGPDFSLYGEFKISNLFSIQPAIEYSSQGGKKDGLQAFATPAQVAAEFPAGEAPQYLYANYNSTAKLNYMMIPVLAKFGWDIKSSPLRFYAAAGPFLGILLSAHQVTSGQSEFYTDPAGTQALPGGAQSFDNNQDIKNQLHSINFGVEGNVGLVYKLSKTCGIFVEGGFNYGFLNIQSVAADGKNNTGAATAEIGYSYWFGK